MKNLLAFEFHKLLRSKALYICLSIACVFLLLSTAVIFIGMAIEKSMAIEQGIDVSAIEEMFSSNSAFDMMTSALSSSSLTSIFGIFAVIFLCDDFSQKTIKNVYSHGFSRSQVFLAKVIVVAVAAVGAYLIVLAFGFAFGLVFFGKVGEIANPLIYLDQLLVLLCNLSLAAFLCFMSKKITVSIGLLLFAPGIIGLVFTIADLIINSETFTLANYWFGNYELLIYKGAPAEKLVTALIGSVAYTALFTTLGWVFNNKNEM